MNYALMLCFEEEVEDRFRTIIEAMAENGVSSSMLDAKIPPHISIACFSADAIEPIIGILDEHISNFTPGTIAWPSLGMFAPQVLFAAPVLNEYLQQACVDSNRLIEPFSEVGENGFYLPYRWVPHTTLALGLDVDGLKKAVDIALKHFSLVSGKSNRLKLVAYKDFPHKVIKRWDLA